MKILLTSPSYYPENNGLSNAVQVQVSMLREQGFDVTVATSGSQRETSSGKYLETIERFTNPVGWFKSLKKNHDSVKYKSFLVEGNWQVVLMNAWQHWMTDVAICNLELISGRKFLYSHGISTNVYFSHQTLKSSLRYLMWRPYWWKLSDKIRKLDGLLVLADGGTDSRFDDYKLARKLGSRISIVPNSLLPYAQSALNDEVVDYGHRAGLMAVGGYTWQKGFDRVLAAYQQSRAFNSIPINFYGQSDTPYLQALRRQAERLGIKSDFVAFHIGVKGDELISEYAKSLLVLSGSYTECQPLVLLDAMATGTPFASYSTGCIAGMSGGVAVLGLADMVKAIDTTIADKEKWRNLSCSGRQEAKRKFHYDVVKHKFLDALGVPKSRV